MMFLNHSCEPNVGVQGQIVFVALRDVAVGEKLTVDYGTIDHDAEPIAEYCFEWVLPGHGQQVHLPAAEM